MVATLNSLCARANAAAPICCRKASSANKRLMACGQCCRASLGGTTKPGFPMLVDKGGPCAKFGTDEGQATGHRFNQDNAKGFGMVVGGQAQRALRHRARTSFSASERSPIKVMRSSRPSAVLWARHSASIMPAPTTKRWASIDCMASMRTFSPL